MKTLFLTILLAFIVLTTQAQKQSKLVADETNLVTLKTSFKIETSNLEIFGLMQKELKEIITKWNVVTRKDRKGEYFEYSIPFKPEHLNRVVQFFEKINKPVSK